uniref:Uncharacterized protein n=1 Tax=Kwoniella bestiolae CBS 10118 TaxID=1296100 RepID=A0A1B9GFU9_9TREE|nr:hypothetical protein I302_01400 [Kwoniella bestiolae CBS 10118]OCF29887.1 hypothetical protein I302_01400 [Kwoniella bestiolae CBS 10118]
MSKSNDSIGERLHSIVFLISPKCSSCKKSMDLVNEAFDAGRSTATILEGSELGDTHIFSRKMSKVGGADLLRHKIAQAYPQRPMVASFVSSRNSFGHNIASEQSRIEEAVRYDWYNVVKNPQSGEGFWTERPTRLKFYFVNVFDHSHALKSLKETYMIDKQNLHMARLESGNLQEMDGGHEGHNTACEEGDAVAQSGRAAADSLSLTRRWFGRGQRSHSLDPRDIPLSSRCKSATGVSGVHELAYKPSTGIPELEAEQEYITSSKGGGYFDPNANPFGE